MQHLMENAWTAAAATRASRHIACRGSFFSSTMNETSAEGDYDKRVASRPYGELVMQFFNESDVRALSLAEVDNFSGGADGTPATEEEKVERDDLRELTLGELDKVVGCLNL
jgi:hypothetical protein